MGIFGIEKTCSICNCCIEITCYMYIYMVLKIHVICIILVLMYFDEYKRVLWTNVHY